MRIRCLAILLALLLAAVWHFGPASAACEWRVFNVPNPDPYDDTLVGVTAVAADDAWAFGYTTGVNGELFHFDGKRWTTITTPYLPYHYFFTDMRALARNDIWAVGGDNVTGAMVAHYDGANWTIVSSPVFNGGPAGVLALGDKSVWVVGGRNISGYAQAFIEHFNGGGSNWDFESVYHPPGTYSYFNAIGGVSASSLWAGGFKSTGTQYSVLMEKKDPVTGSWIEVPGQPARGIIASLSARAASDVWAVGAITFSGPPFVERWDGMAWQPVPYPRGGTAVARQVDATASTGDTWLVGTQKSGASFSAFVDRYRGNWRDMKVHQPSSYRTGLYSIATVPGTAGNVWAVGDYQDSTSGAPVRNLAERYTCR